ncbi:hypothetical protein RhiirA5_424054 [Rhizophagus irregularis]|uniref:Uncharacterized protein n=1 Tax=Rhizophagus irregularis TaxID=588596 RepID=A0A2N0P8S8_9GLOM|nr:hypothetical protein RhiirA5_424054 [Rhizophagus irregularis]
MAQSLCYYMELIEDWLPLLEELYISISFGLYPIQLMHNFIYLLFFNNGIIITSIILNNNIKNWQASSIVQPRDPKQKYGFDMGYAKKAFEYFIESVKSEVRTI